MTMLRNQGIGLCDPSERRFRWLRCRAYPNGRDDEAALPVSWRRVPGIDAGDLHFREIVVVAAVVKTLA
jgi:hypothetical protein